MKKENTFEPKIMMKRNLVVKTTGSYKKIPCEKILYCKADGAYTSIHLNENETIIISKLLKEFENELQEPHFFRISRSHLVNLNNCCEILKNRHVELKLLTGEKLSVSESRAKELIERFCMQ